MEQIILDYNIDEPFYIQIYNHFKTEIIIGNLIKGAKLPSIRGLSMDIKVSKTTIESAYNQLVVEGYVNNIPKKGYFVVALKDYEFTTDKKKILNPAKDKFLDYINNGVDKASFDMKIWRKLYGNILSEKDNKLYTVGDYQGEEVLRQKICEFVQKTRGVKCSSDQIVVGAGIQYLLGILCSLTLEDQYSVAVEYPGFNQAKNVFEDYHMKIIPVPVYDEGIDIEELKQSQAKMVYLSPSHQYPTGSVMPIDKRLDILNWASNNDSIIIEDDYDCLIRYESRPIPALQGLDKGGHVIYLGSFSKILLPSIRISYMILPQKILDRYKSKIGRYSQTSSKIEQLTLAQFMKEGYLEKHLRKIRKVYHRKNEIIVNYINKYAKEKINILGHDSGLHMMFELKTNKISKEIIAEAEKLNIYLEVVEGYHEGKLVVVFTYSGLEEEDIEGILQLLIKNIFYPH
ncbi:aminotransferase class I/II-fold pyridoxal phosphate-dependent enzyme [Alkalibaculum sp. M08DMB]|uniref:Aminotransferase class I/II-fold pyridoxal phosphate-dependent enzyme n=1 Tax=Alkalibaculum sporogenes TaxID=2655001 RepID=A0A6A7K7K0_9FIRM|nr:PLP-dependent aminotransferase family protein [Alkalibaculum sporogenes]MPW25375.1 aminotransferase class I/II-fold pyridoxal phosphate-dependent enzyme [Alkalibaculum sporogenes]